MINGDQKRSAASDSLFTTSTILDGKHRPFDYGRTHPARTLTTLTMHTIFVPMSMPKRTDDVGTKARPRRTMVFGSSARSFILLSISKVSPCITLAPTNHSLFHSSHSFVRLSGTSASPARKIAQARRTFTHSPSASSRSVSMSTPARRSAPPICSFAAPSKSLVNTRDGRRDTRLA